jgi:parallel beta-helix repeat protein
VNLVDRRWIALIMLVVVASSAVVGFFALRSQSHVAVETVEIKYPLAYHSPISLGAESDFTKPGAGSGCECVRSGSGSEADPFVISDWIVNSTNGDGIDIAETSVHFVIARVDLHANSSNSGLYITDAKNGIVENSQITGWWFGAYIFDSSNMEFINDTITGNQYGIQLEASSNNELLANRIEENRELGIFLRGSNTILRDNSVIRNGWGGINVDGTTGLANANQIESNVVSGNAVFGIGVWQGTNNVFRSNTVAHNQVVGIMLTDGSTKNLVEANNVTKNGGSGIIIVGESSGNTIRQNTAKGNGDGVKDFDLYDMASGNVWENNTYDTKKPDSIS